jgi:hypothetical protein
MRRFDGHSVPVATAAMADFEMHFGCVQGRTMCALCHECTISMGMFLVTRFEKGLGGVACACACREGFPSTENYSHLAMKVPFQTYSELWCNALQRLALLVVWVAWH